MLYVDYLVMFIILICTAVNRQSLIILYAFALNEFCFYISDTDFSYCVLAASAFAVTAFSASNIKIELQFSLIWYSVLFWMAGFDYFAFPHETYFYVIFPYIIKLVDIYVIYHLIKRGERAINGNTNAFSCPLY